MNDIPEFQNTPYENESDSEEGSHNKPTEDDEGYLHPYHSLIHPEKKPTRKDGPTNSDQRQYDFLILSKPTDNQFKNTISIDTHLKTTGNRNECTKVNRKTIWNLVQVFLSKENVELNKVL